MLSWGEGDASAVQSDVPAVELAATTRYEEARAVMAVVAALRDRGVRVRDIAVVARDLDGFEEPLTRAAVRRGVTPVYWTQIRLTATEPYLLVSSLYDVFADGEPDLETLLAPVACGWVPREAGDAWPVPSEVLVETRHRLPGGSRLVREWAALLNDAAWADPRVCEFVTWVARDPRPVPGVVEEVLGGAVAAYRETVLPERRAADSSALLETETAARATVRMKTLVEQVRSKFQQRLADGWTEESWDAVHGMCESLAQQRPGRREHGNAHAVDIFEANDIWARTFPFVIAVGFVDGEWPAASNSTLPAEFRRAVLEGTGAAAQLAPRTAWEGGRDVDQFRDTVAAATTALLVTRHTRDGNGNQCARSPLLDYVDAKRVSRSARQQLLSSDGALPSEIESLLPDDVPSTPEVTGDA